MADVLILRGTVTACGGGIARGSVIVPQDQLC
jgi:hypothetical protein